MTLPRISIIGDKQIREGFRYNIYVGYTDNEIVCLALSRYDKVSTFCKLLLETDIYFQSSSVSIDVYNDLKHPGMITATFRSKLHTYCYREEPFDILTNNNTKTEWGDILGVNVSFYPFEGPETFPERFLDFRSDPVTH